MLITSREGLVISIEGHYTMTYARRHIYIPTRYLCERLITTGENYYDILKESISLTELNLLSIDRDYNPINEYTQLIQITRLYISYHITYKKYTHITNIINSMKMMFPYIPNSIIFTVIEQFIDYKYISVDNDTIVANSTQIKDLAEDFIFLEKLSAGEYNPTYRFNDIDTDEIFTLYKHPSLTVLDFENIVSKFLLRLYCNTESDKVELVTSYPLSRITHKLSKEIVKSGIKLPEDEKLFEVILNLAALNLYTTNHLKEYFEEFNVQIEGDFTSETLNSLTGDISDIIKMYKYDDTSTNADQTIVREKYSLTDIRKTPYNSFTAQLSIESQKPVSIIIGELENLLIEVQQVIYSDENNKTLKINKQL